MFALVNNSPIIDICSSRREQQYAKHLNIQIRKEARMEALLSRSKCITFLMGVRGGGGGGAGGLVKLRHSQQYLPPQAL